MAVTPTGAIYKTLTFDNVSSGTYGVHITGEAAYNAPERDVEMIEIPGRNGAFALDKGRFANLEVTYPASIAADDPADFAQAISDFRNQLCSRTGYCRLTDDYNTGEYRMAIYKSGLEVTPAQLKAGEFDITFECKPQRFLTSGETKITVNSGNNVNNPTLFDAKPLLEINGYGSINISSDVISFDGQDIGDIIIASSGHSSEASWNATSTSATQTITIDDAFLASGDTITVPLENDVFRKVISGGNTTQSEVIRFIFTASFAYGTSSTQSDNKTNGIETATITAVYNGSNTITVTYAATRSAAANTTIKVKGYSSEVSAYSTVPSSNSLVYIDLDTGEAWTDNNGDVASLNNRVSMPAELPVLAPGNTTITYDNTVTALKITPRWWIV